MTRTAQWPRANAVGAATREGLTATAPTRSTAGHQMINDFDASLSGRFEIDVWGRLRRGTESARAGLIASEEGRRTVLMTLVTTVAGAYIQLRALDRQLEIARQTSQSLGEASRLQRVRFEQGARPESDYRQADSQYQAAAAQVPELERLIARQENFISVLIGRNSGPIARGRDIEALAFPAVPGALPASLLERRPDILQAEHGLTPTNADI